MINILVTSAGGPAAVGFIKSIRKTNYEVNIVAIDCNKLSSGLYLADDHYIVEPINRTDLSYNWKWFKKIIKDQSIDLIIPSGEAELIFLSTFKLELKKISVEIFISDINTLQMCRDKFLFWQCLKDKFPLPDLIEAVFEKPNRAKGGRGAKLILPGEGKKLWEYLPGQEYTVDVFCDKFSNSLGTIVRERLGIKEGISVQGRIIRNRKMEKLSEDLCIELGIKGPCCIQFKRDKYDNVKLLECNPRLGGGTYFSTLGSVNPAQIYLDLYEGKKVKKLYPEEKTITRYYEEIVI